MSSRAFCRISCTPLQIDHDEHKPVLEESLANDATLRVVLQDAEEETDDSRVVFLSSQPSEVNPRRAVDPPFAEFS